MKIVLNILIKDYKFWPAVAEKVKQANFTLSEWLNIEDYMREDDPDKVWEEGEINHLFLNDMDEVQRWAKRYPKMYYTDGNYVGHEAYAIVNCKSEEEDLLKECKAYNIDIEQLEYEEDSDYSDDDLICYDMSIYDATDVIWSGKEIIHEYWVPLYFQRIEEGDDDCTEEELAEYHAFQDELDEENYGMVWEFDDKYKSNPEIITPIIGGPQCECTLLRLYDY